MANEVRTAPGGYNSSYVRNSSLSPAKLVVLDKQGGRDD